MAWFSPLASLFVAIMVNLFSAECGTSARAGHQSLHQRSSSSIDNLISSPSNKLCSRLCGWILEHRDERKVISFDQCVKDCKQKKTPKAPEKERDLTLARYRMQRSIKNDNKMCHGLSDNGLPYPTHTPILKVDFKAHSSEEHHYNVSWKPFVEAELKRDNINWTHYALLYQFYNKYNQDRQHMECVLVPKNRTFWILKHSPHWSPSNEPDHLGSAVVVFPYRSKSESNIPIHDFDPLRPTFIPTFIPVFATKKAPKFNIVAPIAGGTVALLIVLLMAILWRRKRLCRYQDPRRQPVIDMLNNVAETPATADPSSPENANELYYSCYYPENDSFRDKVASIVNFFRMKGYDVIMDAMVSSEISSQGPTLWAETQIRRATKVLVFLSPSLVKLAFNRCEELESQDLERVWIELEVLRNIFSRNHSAAKMVCIELPDAPVRSLELPVWVKVIYRWPGDFEKILRRLNDRPSILPLVQRM